MSDRIVVMNKGQVVQDGTPREIYAQPNSIFASDFIGETNLLSGVVADVSANVARIQVGSVLLAAPSSGWMDTGASLTLSIRPEDVVVSRDTLENYVTGAIAEVVYLGNRVRARIRSPLDCDLWIEQSWTSNTLTLEEGREIGFVLPARALRVFESAAREPHQP